MKVMLVLLATCAFSAAMVPKKRAVNSQELSSEAPMTTQRPHEICARQTPCAWSIYQPKVKLVEHTIINSYCECGPGLKCEVTDDDSTVSALIHRCRIPSIKKEGEESLTES